MRVTEDDPSKVVSLVTDNPEQNIQIYQHLPVYRNKYFKNIWKVKISLHCSPHTSGIGIDIAEYVHVTFNFLFGGPSL